MANQNLCLAKAPLGPAQLLKTLGSVRKGTTGLNQGRQFLCSSVSLCQCTEKLMGAALGRIRIAYVSLTLPADHKHSTNESSSVSCAQLECTHCFSFVLYNPFLFNKAELNYNGKCGSWRVRKTFCYEGTVAKSQEASILAWRWQNTLKSEEGKFDAWKIKENSIWRSKTKH